MNRLLFQKDTDRQDFRVTEMNNPHQESYIDGVDLSRKEPDRDIDIVYTGLRPGEKL